MKKKSRSLLITIGLIIIIPTIIVIVWNSLPSEREIGWQKMLIMGDDLFENDSAFSICAKCFNYSSENIELLNEFSKIFEYKYTPEDHLLIAIVGFYAQANNIDIIEIDDELKDYLHDRTKIEIIKPWKESHPEIVEQWQDYYDDDN